MAFPVDCPPATPPPEGTIPFPPDAGEDGPGTDAGNAVSDLWPGPACRNGFDRSTLTALFVQFLRYHFGNPVAHGVRHPLRDRPWRPDGLTGIQIYGEGEDNIYPELFPAVMVRAGAERKGQKLGIGGLVDAPFGKSRSYGELRVGSHSLICQGRTAGEADLVAAEVDGVISAFLPRFRDLMELSVLEFAQRDDAVKIAGTENEWAVPIGYAWAYVRETRIIQQAPLIRDTVFTTSPRAARRPAGP